MHLFASLARPVETHWSPPTTKEHVHAASARVPVLSALVWLGLLMGAILVTYAYAYAANPANYASQTYFHLFWLGALLFTVPACLRLCSAGAPRGERLAIIAAIGLFDYLPKFIRSPQYPLFHDELAHWRQAEVTYATGKLFKPNPVIDIIQFFPGLHALTADLRALTGIPTFQVAEILLAALHVIALIGIFVLAEHVTHSAHIAGLAAFIYSLNPSFMYFDTQYAYESLAIVFVIWVIVAILHVQDTAREPAQQWGWFAIGLILAGGCIVTHHLSTYILAIVLVMITAVTVIRALRGTESRRNAALTAAFTALFILGALAWLIFVASGVVGYLAPSLKGGITEIIRMINHEQSSRKLFAQSVSPAYERLFAFLSPAIAAGGAAVGLWLLRRRWPRTSASLGLIAFGLLYFPSVPFMLTQTGNEGARRSWAFSYIGLCLLVAPAIPWLLQWAKARLPGTRPLAVGAITVLLSIVLIGNVAMHMSVEYRFPGPYVYGSDTRSLTPELIGAVRWFRTTQGTDQNLITDRYSGLGFSSFGQDWTASPSRGFPVYNLYFDTSLPQGALGRKLLQDMRSSGYQYMVVDTRMSKFLPRIGVYFEPDEPGAYIRSVPVLNSALTKYERLPWTIKIYQSNDLQVYRLNYPGLRVRWTPPGRKHA